MSEEVKKTLPLLKYRVELEKRLEINKSYKERRNRAIALRILSYGLFGQKRFQNLYLSCSLNCFYWALQIANILHQRVPGLAMVIKFDIVTVIQYYDGALQNGKAYAEKKYTKILIKLTKNPTEDDKKEPGFNAGLESQNITNELKEVIGRQDNRTEGTRRPQNRGGRYNNNNRNNNRPRPQHQRGQGREQGRGQGRGYQRQGRQGRPDRGQGRPERTQRVQRGDRAQRVQRGERRPQNNRPPPRQRRQRDEQREQRPAARRPRYGDDRDERRKYRDNQDTAERGGQKRYRNNDTQQKKRGQPRTRGTAASSYRNTERREQPQKHYQQKTEDQPRQKQDRGDRRPRRNNRYSQDDD